VEPRVVEVNRAPVLTLWAAVVAARMGHEWPAALSLGKAVAGLTAQAKGRTLGIYAKKEPRAAGEGKQARRGEDQWITVCGRPVPVRRTPEGIRAVVKESPVAPDAVERYLSKSFGESLPAVRQAMESLAGSFSAAEIEPVSYGLYERFRPVVASGTRGWGQKGVLDLELIRSLAGKK
jgi:hypothetical protein